MFIARENEINELESRYRTEGFEFAIIYGRRRIGKTRLIEELSKDKDSIFFSAMKDSSRKESLFQLSKDHVSINSNFKTVFASIHRRACRESMPHSQAMWMAAE